MEAATDDRFSVATLFASLREIAKGKAGKEQRTYGRNPTCKDS